MAWKDRESQQRYHRKHYKERLSAMKRRFGNKCCYCSYDSFPEILVFAHKHDTEKYAAVSTLTRASMKKLEAELKKCMLLCPNCHALYDKGLIPQGK